MNSRYPAQERFARRNSMKIATISDHSVAPNRLAQKKGQREPGEETKVESRDEYVPAPLEEKQTIYGKRPASDHVMIQRLQEESEKAHEHLRRLVIQLLERQGLSFADALGREDVKVDEETRLAAKQLIGEGGLFSPEAVSERILDFARALAGGDKSKIGMLRSAIEEGFAQAAKMFGGELPEISHRTWDLISEKLDQWEQAV